jgi:hypothetical protein
MAPRRDEAGPYQNTRARVAAEKERTTLPNFEHVAFPEYRAPASLEEEAAFAMPDRPLGEIAKRKATRKSTRGAKAAAELQSQASKNAYSASATATSSKPTSQSHRAITDANLATIEDDTFFLPDHYRSRTDFGDRDSDDEGEDGRVQGHRADGTYFEEHVYCICAQPTPEDMTQCKMCDEYFHPACLGVESFIRCIACEVKRSELEAKAQRMMKPLPTKELRQQNVDKLNKRRREMEEFDTLGQVERRVKRARGVMSMEERRDSVVDHSKTEDPNMMDIDTLREPPTDPLWTSTVAFQTYLDHHHYELVPE